MTDQAVADALTQYRAGLDAEIALLEQLDVVAARQRRVTADRDFARLRAESDERERLTRALVTLEQGLKEVRALLARSSQVASSLPGYDQVVALRQTAVSLVSRILATDDDSMQALADAELARRAAVASLDQGETTLAAYRRVLAPTMAHPSLLDRRG